MLWNVLFFIRNYVFEKSMIIHHKPPFGSEITYKVLPNDKGTTVSIIFDTDEISKPDFLQRRLAKTLFSMFKEISAPFIRENFDAEVIESYPVSEKDKRKYNDMEGPDDSFFMPEPKIVKSAVIQKIEETFFKVHTGKFMFSVKDLSNYQGRIILGTILRWYNRSLEHKGLLDKFVSLWVTFNVIYEYLWNPARAEKHPKAHHKIAYCIRHKLNEDEPKRILEPHKFILPRQMPDYELIGHKGEEEKIDEMLKSKDMKKIEACHKEFLKKEKDWRLNKKDSWLEKKGFNFGKYWYAEDWVNSLVQVLLNIYQLRNSVFHSGVIPKERIEGIIDDPDEFHDWIMRIDILSKVDALLITKILNHFSRD